MKPSGADILWSCLVEQGVDTVFGYPGGAILPAYRPGVVALLGRQIGVLAVEEWNDDDSRR